MYDIYHHVLLMQKISFHMKMMNFEMTVNKTISEKRIYIDYNATVVLKVRQKSGYNPNKNLATILRTFCSSLTD